MRDHSWWYGVGGITSFATAAVDIAIWDAKGKVSGRSVVDLLGGPVHTRLPAVASIHAMKAEIPEMAEDIRDLLTSRFQGVKVGFGKKGDAHLGIDQSRDVEFVRAVRKSVGPDRMIMIDIGNAIQWDVTTAVERIRAMEDHGLTWIEEPLGANNPEGYATLRAKTSTRIAYGEREWNLAGFRRILETGTVDVVGVDPGRSEGITGFRKACDLIEAHTRQANAHAWSSAIVTMASLAVSFNSPACKVFEMKPVRNPMHHELVVNPPEPVDGWVYPPTGVGLGIQIVEEVVHRYRLS
jgi:L-alanine-DL-glutamate epimerase-like enolase superfamily enzyme